MLISLEDVILNNGGTPPSFVIHCGAHEGEEVSEYVQAGISVVVWIEANPALIRSLKKRVGKFKGQVVIEACLGPTSGEEVTFHIAETKNRTNRGQSSSLLELGTHKVAHPEVSYVKNLTLTTSTVDELMEESLVGVDGPVMMNLDLQGAELMALAGAEATIPNVDIIFSEVNCDELYKGCALLPAYDAWLVAHGFEIKLIRLAGCQRRDCSDGGNRWVGWGDMVAYRVENPRPFSETHPEEAKDWYS